MATTSSTTSTSATAQIVSTLGAGSGINLSQLAEQLAAAQFAARKDALTAKSEKLTTQISSASNLKSLMSTLSSSIGSLIRTGDLAVNPSISSSSVATVSKGTGTGSGTYELEVSSLATAQKLVGQAYDSSSSTVGSGTLTLRFGTVSGSTFTEDESQDAVDITIESGATLADVAIAINASGAGVSAYVANGSSGAQLVIKGATGQTSGFIIEATETDGDAGLADLAWTPSTDSGELKSTAADAAFTLDGVAYTSDSNTLTDIVTGLTIKLTGTNSGSPATIGFDDPSDSISSAMSDLVEALNEVVSELTDAMDMTSGTLGNDSGARALRSALTSLAGQEIMPDAADGEPSTLADLGLKIERDGTFSLDSSRLKATLESYPEAAGAMWTTGLYGVFATIDSISRTASSTTGYGSLGGSVTRYTAMKATVDKQATTLDEKQEDMRQRLVTRFAVMDTNVSASQSTLSFLKAQIAAWNSSDN